MSRAGFSEVQRLINAGRTESPRLNHEEKEDVSVGNWEGTVELIEWQRFRPASFGKVFSGRNSGMSPENFVNSCDFVASSDGSSFITSIDDVSSNRVRVNAYQMAVCQLRQLVTGITYRW